MKPLIYLWALLAVGSTFYGQTQQYSTMETKVILVAPLKTDIINEIILFNTFQELYKEGLSDAYSDCRFFIGTYTGTYQLKEDEVLPMRGATIVIFTDELLYPNDKVISEIGFSPANNLKLGQTSFRVAGHIKEELILKVL